MGQNYQDLDRPHFDYDLQRLAGLKAQFRGPAIDKSQAYIACIGGAQTFGRFCMFPYPMLLADTLAIQTLNLGVGGAGPRHFLRPAYLDRINGAEAVVIHVMSARSESNPLFATAGTNRGVQRSDGKRMNFDEFYTELTAKESWIFVNHIIDVMCQNYVRSAIALLDRIQVPKVLLWLSKRAPEEQQRIRTFPQFVNRSMVDQIKEHADSYIECVWSKGIPQKLWPASEPIAGAFLKDGTLLNRYYPSPQMHAKAATMLVPACRAVI